MRVIFSLILFGSLLFSTTGSYAQSSEQVGSIAKSMLELEDHLQAATDIIIATQAYGPHKVHQLCLAAEASLTQPTFRFQWKFPVFGDVKSTVVERCIAEFCASGGNQSLESKTAMADYCKKG